MHSTCDIFYVDVDGQLHGDYDLNIRAWRSALAPSQPGEVHKRTQLRENFTFKFKARDSSQCSWGRIVTDIVGSLGHGPSDFLHFSLPVSFYSQDSFNWLFFSSTLSNIGYMSPYSDIRIAGSRDSEEFQEWISTVNDPSVNSL